MNGADIKEQDARYIARTYNRYDVALAEGMGCVCYDDKGREYLDMGSGIGVNSLGYCDPGWAAAVTAQAARLNHTSNLYYTQPCADLAEKLCRRTGYERVFFANSGAEANECAIKTARKYSADRYGEGRDKIYTLVNSFHGRTVTTLSATGQDCFHRYFGPFTEGFGYLPAGDTAALLNADYTDVCAVMIEFVQGEGGVVPLAPEFVRALADLCAEKDVLLIADEVQTGAGRTGKFLASEHYGVRPDITTMAKGLGGGLPLGAALLGEKCKDVLGFSQHGTTFGGNPIVCAGACYVLDRLTDELLAEVERKGAYLRALLADCAEIERIDGFGLMLGLVLKSKSAADVVRRGTQNGILMLTAKEKIRLLPPLVITREELERAAYLIKELLK